MTVNWTIVAFGLGAFGNLVWMLVTLRIENKIGAKIDALKDWMEGRYVSTGVFEGYKSTIAVQHVEIERRLVKLELNGCDLGACAAREHAKAAK